MEETLANNSINSTKVKQEDDIFEFETESMALKGNKDYKKLLQSLNVLTALRTQALMDIDKVLEVESEALTNPLEFIKKLKNGEDIGIPQRVEIPKVPEIDWSKYKLNPSLEAFRPATRPKARDNEVGKGELSESVVRGRLKKEDKSETFNQLWTTEEQLKLEELLLKYPPEDNEARRFAKIANELGNRTLAQVTSRCQKYFLKLYRAGLPVPGRPPRIRSNKTKLNPHYGQRFSTTFFPRSCPPVSLSDSDLAGTSSVDVGLVKMEPLDSEESEFSDGAKSVREPRKLVLLRRVRADLVRHKNEPVCQEGFMCNICKEEPLVGTRWHCLQCKDVDMCSACLVSQLEGEPQHPVEHQLASYRPVRSAGGDKDYAVDMGSYNYLDTCFQPD